LLGLFFALAPDLLFALHALALGLFFGAACLFFGVLLAACVVEGLGDAAGFFLFLLASAFFFGAARLFFGCGHAGFFFAQEAQLLGVGFFGAARLFFLLAACFVEGFGDAACLFFGLLALGLFGSAVRLLLGQAGVFFGEAGFFRETGVLFGEARLLGLFGGEARGFCVDRRDLRS
jgi:hypothetical protein